METDYPVRCPITGNEIDEETCFDIHMVVSRVAPKNTAPSDIYKNPDYKDVCLHCRHHRGDC